MEAVTTCRFQRGLELGLRFRRAILPRECHSEAQSEVDIVREDGSGRQDRALARFDFFTSCGASPVDQDVGMMERRARGPDSPGRGQVAHSL